MSILAMGRPVLVTAIGQFLEIPDDACVKIGLGPNERNELVACFRALRENPEVAAELGRNARAFVEDLNWDRIARRVEDLLRSIALPNPTV
jgi:glycosyltransferase involved in cell wall biosynthesis